MELKSSAWEMMPSRIGWQPSSSYKLTGINSSSQAAKEGRFILAEDGDAIYAAEFFESGWNCGLDEAGVRDSFRLILSNWAGD